MEEIYIPENIEQQSADIRQRGEHNLLGEMPLWFIHTGSYIIYGIILLILGGGALFRYPDVVDVPIRIDNMSKVEWVTVNHSGKLDRFLVPDGATVKVGDTLCVLQNDAAFDDVRMFIRMLTGVEQYYRTNDLKYLTDYRFDLIMGDMSNAYQKFTETVRSIVHFHEFDTYQRRRAFMQEELKLLQQQNTNNELVILRARRDAFELETEHTMTMARNRRALEVAYEDMVNSLKRWDAAYLVKSKSNGTLTIGQSLETNNIVNVGDTLCTVTTEQEGKLAGHIRLTQREVAEIAVGDKVNIRLEKYPAHTYGVFVGEVTTVQFVPSGKYYAVNVSFPENSRLHTDERMRQELLLTGEAQIITAERSVLSRILTPLKNIISPLS